MSLSSCGRSDEVGMSPTQCLSCHRLGGEAHSMVWDPSGERLAVLMKGKEQRECLSVFL